MAKKISKELEELIVLNYQKGISPYQMVKTIPELSDKRPSVIYGILERLGIKTNRTIKITEEQKRNRRKYQVNDDYFETIDTEEKAYWLGFIYADGYVMSNSDKVGIALSSIDKSHLEKFKKAITFTGEIKDYVETGGYAIGATYSRILITSSKLKKDLMRHGIVPNKTDIIKFPTMLSKDLLPHFIRGYFDGDGCITHQSKQVSGNLNYMIKITGTLDMIKNIESSIGVNFQIAQRFPERNKDNYQIETGGNLKVKQILRYMYENATIFLDRKYNTVLKCMQQ